MGTTLILGGRVIDPSRSVDGPANILIEGPKIKYVGPRSERADQVIDARGKAVVPGLVDMHVHFREPGNEEEETIASGAASAVAGGFTSVATMPNTDPACDSEAGAEFVTLQSRRAGRCNVFPIGAVTKGRAGKELSEMGQLYRGGAVGFSDDGSPVESAQMMRNALLYSKMFHKPIIAHCEERSLVGSGVMNAGLNSCCLGLAGWHAVGEEIMVHRDITLARVTGGRVHIAHISTAGSVDLVRKAKAQGLHVTAEVTPHHLTLTEDCCRSYDPVYKMNPPLRTQTDIEALIVGLKDGTIDVCASDHAPHTPEEKDVEFSAAPFGVIGVETMFPVLYTSLVLKGHLTLPQLIAKLTVHPCQILGVAKGTLAEGADADITVLDLEREWIIDRGRLRSKSRNCPWHGWTVKGRAVQTIVGGLVFQNEG